MWNVGDIVAARLYKGDYHLVRIQKTRDAGGEYLCLVLGGETLMLYIEAEIRRVVVSFAGPVVVEHNGHDGPEVTRCLWPGE